MRRALGCLVAMATLGSCGKKGPKGDVAIVGWHSESEEWAASCYYPPNWDEMGPGDRRLPEIGDDAPSKEELLDELRRQHDCVVQTLQETPEDVFGVVHEWKLSHHLPRTADIVMFQCLHEMLHLGQLASWRRAMQLPAAMARMAELRV